MGKRILTIILTLTMLFTMTVASVSATSTSPTITLESVQAENGQDVTVKVLIENNPGIWGMDLRISYDKSALTLTSVENGNFYQESEWTPGNLNSDIYILSYEASGFDNITTQSGLLATLNFKVSDTASVGDYAVTAIYNAGDIINVDFDEINFDIVNGKVSIQEKNIEVSCAHTNKTTVPEKISNCKDAGWDAYVQCDDCGQLFKADGSTELSEIPFRVLSKEHTPADVWSKDKTHHWKECNVFGCGVVIDESKEPHTSTGAAENGVIKCSVCGYEMGMAPVTDTGTIDKMSATLELENIVHLRIIINSYTGFNNTNLRDKMGLLVWNGEQELSSEDAIYENAEEVIDGAGYDEANGRYYVKSNGISAKKLGDTLWMRVYVDLGDGNYVYSKLFSYSPLKYLENAINTSTNAELVDVCKALVNYGAAAQLNFNYKTDSLMNAFLSEKDKIMNWSDTLLDAVDKAEDSKAEEFVRNSNVFTGRGATLALEGAINILFRFMISNDAVADAEEMGILYWSKDTYEANAALTMANADLVSELTYDIETGRYVNEYPGIAAKDLGDTVYACAYVKDSEGTYSYSGVISYSVETYVANAINNASENTKNVTKWLVIYGNCAKEYFY